MAYNINPYPQQGQGAFGLVPGPIGLPSPASDLASAYPNLSGTNQAVSGAILGQLGGNISPGTLKALQNAAATFGVQSGMPGSGLQWNNLFGNIAGFAEGQVQKGLQNYGAIIPTVSRTQTLDPALQAEIASQNALYGAAPNPQAAQSYAQGLFNQYLNSLRGAPTTRGPSAGSDYQGPTTGVRGGSFGTPDVAYGALPEMIGSTILPPSASSQMAQLPPEFAPGAGGGTPESQVEVPDVSSMSDDELLSYISGG